MKKIRYLLITSLLLITAVFSTSCRKDFDIGTVKINIKIGNSNQLSREADTNITNFDLFIIRQNSKEKKCELYETKRLHSGKNYIKLKNPDVYNFIILPLNKDNKIIGKVIINDKSYVNNSKNDEYGYNSFYCSNGDNNLFFDVVLDSQNIDLNNDENNNYMSFSNFKNKIETETKNNTITDSNEISDINKVIDSLIPYTNYGFLKTFNLNTDVCLTDDEIPSTITIPDNCSITINGNTISRLDASRAPIIYYNNNSVTDELEELFLLNNNAYLNLNNIIISGTPSSSSSPANLKSGSSIIKVLNDSTFVGNNLTISNYTTTTTNDEFIFDDSSIISGIINATSLSNLKHPNSIILDNISLNNCNVRHLIYQYTGIVYDSSGTQDINFYSTNVGYSKISNIYETESNDKSETITTNLPLILSGSLYINSICLGKDAKHMMTYENIEDIKDIKNIKDIINSDSKIKLILDRDIDNEYDTINSESLYIYTAGKDFSCKEYSFDSKFYVFSNINEYNNKDISIDTKDLFSIQKKNYNFDKYMTDPETGLERQVLGYTVEKDNHLEIYKNFIVLVPELFPEEGHISDSFNYYWLTTDSNDKNYKWERKILNADIKYQEVPYILLKSNTPTTEKKDTRSVDSLYFTREHIYYADEDVTINFSNYLNFDYGYIEYNPGLTYYSDNGRITLEDGTTNKDSYLLQWKGDVNLTNVDFSNTDKGLEIYTKTNDYNISLSKCNIPSIKITDIAYNKENPSNYTPSPSRVVITANEVFSTINDTKIIIRFDDDKYIKQNYIDANIPLFTQNTSYDPSQYFELDSMNYCITNTGYISEKSLEGLLQTSIIDITPIKNIETGIKSNISNPIVITSDKTINITKGTYSSLDTFYIDIDSPIYIKNNSSVTFNNNNILLDFYDDNSLINDFSIFNVEENSSLNISNIIVSNKKIGDYVNYCHVKDLFVNSKGTTNISNATFKSAETNRATINIEDGTTTLTNVNFLRETEKDSNSSISIRINNKGKLILKNTGNEQNRIDYILVNFNINQTEPPITFDESFSYYGNSKNKTKNLTFDFSASNTIQSPLSSDDLKVYIKKEQTIVSQLSNFVYIKDSNNYSNLIPIFKTNLLIGSDDNAIFNPITTIGRDFSFTNPNPDHPDWYYLTY